MATQQTGGDTVDKLDSNVFLDFVAQSAMTQRDTTMAATRIATQENVIKNATEESVAAIRAAANADEIAATALHARRAETDSANALAKSFLGLNPQEASFRLQKLSQTRQEAYDRVQEIAGQIAEKKSATLLSDPIGFINAQFTLPADTAQYNYYATLHNNASAEYDDIVSAGTATGQMNKALEATTSVAEASAAVAKIKAKAQQDEATLAIQGAQLQIEGVKALQALSVSQLTQANLRISAYAEQENMKLRAEQFAAAQEQRRLAREEAAAKRKSKEEAEADEEQMVAAYNLAATRDGYAQLPRSVILARIKRAGPDGDLVRLAVTRGENLLLANGNAEAVPVGKNAVESALYFSNTGGTPVGTNASTVNFLKNKLADFGADPRVVAAKDPKEKAAILNQLLAADAVRQQGVIRDNEPNIYAAMTPLALASAVPALRHKGHKFLQETVFPMSEAQPQQPISDDAIVSAAIATINKEPARLQEIVNTLNTYYVAAAKANNALKGYTQMGLPTQSGYNAQLRIKTLGNPTLTVVDLTDPLALKTHIMRQGVGSREVRNALFAQ